MKILCVDDDVVARKIYLKRLQKALSIDEIFEGSSGEEAIELLKKYRIDIVITDLVMPGISGLNVLKESKIINPKCEVIVVTGKASMDTAVKAMQNGARDYLEKPINIPLLIEKIDNIRDLCARTNEAEEYRLAKEVIEKQADHEVHLLERRFQNMQTAVNQTVEKIHSLQRSQEIHSFKKPLNEIISLLKPFCEDG